MTRPSSTEVTHLLQAWSDGDSAALDKLTPLVYRELYRLARHYMAGERSGHTLQPTALINEAYLRLINWKDVQWQNRAHFFAMSAQVMRRVLVDFARSRGYVKRGGGQHRVSLEKTTLPSIEKSHEILALDEALCRLTALDPRKVQVVELRFFAGLSLEETAEVLKVSPFTVKRDWKLAKMWLLREISGRTDSNPRRTTGDSSA